MDETLNAARDAAANETTERLMSSINQVLGKKSTRSLEPMKGKLRSHRREKMRTRSLYMCDSCDTTIHKEDEGFVVHGNIYVACPNGRGGLIGNNFPEVNPGETIEVLDVKENVFCLDCFMRALGLNEKFVRVPDHSAVGRDRMPMGMPAGEMQANSMVSMSSRPSDRYRGDINAPQMRRSAREAADDSVPMEQLRRNQANRQSDNEPFDEAQSFLRTLENMDASDDVEETEQPTRGSTGRSRGRYPEGRTPERRPREHHGSLELMTESEPLDDLSVGDG